jgi:hypothetical protein
MKNKKGKLKEIWKENVWWQKGQKHPWWKSSKE